MAGRGLAEAERRLDILKYTRPETICLHCGSQTSGVGGYRKPLAAQGSKAESSDAQKGAEVRER